MPISLPQTRVSIPIILSINLLAIFSFAPLFADTIFLKNKSQIDGYIESETKDAVEINLGFGTTTFQRDEIDHIVKSDTKETTAIWQEWGDRKKEIEKRKPEEEKKWRERQAELEKIRNEEKKLKKDQEEYGPKTIHITAKDGQILVNTLLNDEARATLILDSGAGTVVLTRGIADKLGVNVDALKKRKTQVADGRWVDMGFTVLKSVRVQNIGQNDKTAGVEAKNIDVCIVLEDFSDKGRAEDGLLGMAFLKNFKFNADYKNGTVTFEPLKEETAAEGTSK